MGILKSATRRLRRLNNMLFSRLLSFACPRYGKRIFFVVSIYTVMGGEECKRHELLALLNSKLHLAEDAKALGFPAILAGLVLNQQEVDTVVCSICQGRHFKDGVKLNEIHEIAKELAQKAPAWVRYSNLERMKDDAERTLIAANEIPTMA